MSDLRFALVPVDQEIARKRRWHEMPLPGLITRLKEKAAKGGMLQSDQPLPLGAGGAVKEDKLYIEVTL
jgi:hypothetical protein